MVASPLPSRGPKRGRKCYVTPAFSGVPNAKCGDNISSGYLTLAFLGARKRAGLLRNPWVRNVKRGDKISSATSPRLSLRPIRGQNWYATPAFSWVPNTKHADKIRNGYLNPAFSGAEKRAELLRNPHILGRPHCKAQGGNQKWLPHPCLLGGPKEGGSAL